MFILRCNERRIAVERVLGGIMNMKATRQGIANRCYLISIYGLFRRIVMCCRFERKMRGYWLGFGAVAMEPEWITSQ